MTKRNPPAGATAAAPAPAVETAETQAPAQPNANFKLFVAYVASTGTGQITANSVITGVLDIFTAADVEAIQKLISEQIKIEQVHLINWKPLRG